MSDNPFLFDPTYSLFDPTPRDGSLVFVASGQQEVLRFEMDGRIFFRGRLIETDEELVAGLRGFLQMTQERWAAQTLADQTAGILAENARIVELLRKKIILYTEIDGPIIDQKQREMMADMIEREQPK